MPRWIVVVLVLTACSPPGTTAVTVIDGDTLVAVVDGRKETIRLIGVNAPELDECFGLEAKQTLETLVAARTLVLERDSSDRDSYGRLLRHVMIGGQHVGRLLVLGGFALAHPVGRDHLYQDRLHAAERAAKDAGSGWWDPAACGSVSPAEVEIASWQPDPPGPDEWGQETITLTNRAATDLSLRGWTLRDASSVHRYRFPAQTVMSPGGSLTVSTACGIDGPGILHWCVQRSIWDNAGDDIVLLNERGAIAAHVDYRGGTGEGR